MGKGAFCLCNVIVYGLRWYIKQNWFSKRIIARRSFVLHCRNIFHSHFSMQNDDIIFLRLCRTVVFVFFVFYSLNIIYATDAFLGTRLSREANLF